MLQMFLTAVLAYLFHRTLSYAPDAAPIERASAALAPVLGPERVRATYQQLMKLVRDPNFLRLDEKPGYIRVSKRNPEQRVV